jgi:DNA-binding MarR family transcriptional regulator
MPRTKTPASGQAISDLDLLHLERFVPYRLSVLANIVSISIAQAYERQFGLSIPEWRVMAVLAQSPGLSAIEVAQRTAMDKVAVSRAVQSLLATKRIRRALHENDRRRTRLQLSEQGMAVYRRVVPQALTYEEQLLGALSVTQRRGLNRLMDTLLTRATTLARAGRKVKLLSSRDAREMRSL